MTEKTIGTIHQIAMESIAQHHADNAQTDAVRHIAQHPATNTETLSIIAGLADIDEETIDAVIAHPNTDPTDKNHLEKVKNC